MSDLLLMWAARKTVPPPPPTGPVDKWSTGGLLGTGVYVMGYGEAGGRLYTVAGYTTNSSAYTNKTQQYDPATNSWTVKAVYPKSYMGLRGEGVGGVLYMFSGGTNSGVFADSYKYTPASNTWTSVAAKPLATGYHGTATYDGKIYCLCGMHHGLSAQNTSYNHVYDPGTNTWASKAQTTSERRQVMACADASGVHVLGGSTAVGVITTHEIYDPAENAWSSAAALPEASTYGRAAVLDGKIYCLLGTTGALVRLEPDTQTWSTLAYIGEALHNGGFTPLGGKLYWYGGKSGVTGGRKDTLIYEP